MAASILVLIIGYIIYNYIKIRESGPHNEEIQVALRSFTKPLKFNVEEVKYTREKGLCLVCKNKISGLTYVCPKCNAFYCIKCSEALTNLENTCWICDTSIDESKPVKIDK